MIFIKIYLAGLVVLIVAVGLNLAAKGMGMATWYDFLNQIAETNLSSTLQSLNLLDYVFLIIVYPALLGLSTYLVFNLTRYF